MEWIGTSDFITLLTGIATLISSIAGLWMIIEVKKQRLAVYKPDIHFPSFVIHVAGKPFSPDYAHLNFRVEPYNKDSKVYTTDANEQRAGIPVLYHPLANVGAGPAKHITLQWVFDFHEAFDKLNSVFSRDYTFNLSEDWFGLGPHIFVHSKENSKCQLTTFSAKNLRSDIFIEYILPEFQKPNDNLSSIPDIIIDTHTYYALLVMANSDSEYFLEEYAGFPKATVIINYSDSFRKKYRKRYQLDFCFMNTPGNNNLGIFHVQVKEM